jgi:L-amino acid N-acyltransferase YncA
MIRLATAADAAAVAAIYGPIVEDTSISFETAVPGAAEMAGRIESVLAYAPWLVWADGGEVQGYAYASRHNDRAAYLWSVNVSVYVHAAHRRRGLARSLYACLFELLRLQGFYTAHAGITLPNAPSVATHESLGFALVGVYRSVGFKRGAWHDVGWWQLPLRAREGVPRPPGGLEAAAARATLLS